MHGVLGIGAHDPNRAGAEVFGKVARRQIQLVQRRRLVHIVQTNINNTKCVAIDECYVLLCEMCVFEFCQKNKSITSECCIQFNLQSICKMSV